MSDCCGHKEHPHQKHPSHYDDLPRLNKISGQVDGIKKMIAEGRYCPDIMIQIKAIRSALKSVEANMLERHLASCVSDAIQSGSEEQQSEKIAEIKELFRKFED